VVRVRAERVRRQVFNLTVEGQPEYFANGVLVHNCRYMVMHLDADAQPITKLYGKGFAEQVG
jgi:hypothetical protein